MIKFIAENKKAIALSEGDRVQIENLLTSETISGWIREIDEDCIFAETDSAKTYKFSVYNRNEDDRHIIFFPSTERELGDWLIRYLPTDYQIQTKNRFAELLVKEKRIEPSQSIIFLWDYKRSKVRAITPDEKFLGIYDYAVNILL